MNRWKLRGKWMGTRWTVAGKWMENDGMHGQRMEMHGTQLHNVWKIDASSFFFFYNFRAESKKRAFFWGGGAPMVDNILAAPAWEVTERAGQGARWPAVSRQRVNPATRPWGSMLPLGN